MSVLVLVFGVDSLLIVNKLLSLSLSLPPSLNPVGAERSQSSVDCQ